MGKCTSVLNKSIYCTSNCKHIKSKTVKFTWYLLFFNLLTVTYIQTLFSLV